MPSEKVRVGLFCSLLPKGSSWRQKWPLRLSGAFNVRILRIKKQGREGERERNWNISLAALS